jgi:hypothetical protein
MKFSRMFVWGIFWTGGTLLAGSALVYAFNPQPDPPGHYYGIMTLPEGQRVSLHVANARMAVDAFRPANSMCVADLRLVNACGQTVAQQSARLSPTSATSLNFTVPRVDPDLPPGPCAETRIDHPPDTDVPPDPGHQRLRAQVVFTGLAGHCVSSLEVGDPFGVENPTRAGSGFIHPGVIVGFNPQPDPPGAPGKILR